MPGSGLGVVGFIVRLALRGLQSEEQCGSLGPGGWAPASGRGHEAAREGLESCPETSKLRAGEFLATSGTRESGCFLHGARKLAVSVSEGILREPQGPHQQRKAALAIGGVYR